MTDQPRRLPGVRSLAGACLLALLAVLFVPFSVEANHGGGLVSSLPVDQSIVASAPSKIVLEFDGPVGDEVTILVRQGNQRVETGDPQISGPTVTVPVSTDVNPGIFTVVYEVRVNRPEQVHQYEGTIRYTVTPSGCTSTVTNLGPFTSITAPVFGTAPDRLRVAAVDKNFQQVIYASNGRELQRSVDSGCTWTVALDLAAEGFGQDAVIAEVASASEVPGLASVLVLDPVDEGGNVVQPTVYVAGGPNAPLVAGGLGLEPVRFDPEQPLFCRHPQPCQFAYSDAPVVQRGLPTLYLLTEPAFELGAVRLFRSSDAGQTFTATGPIVTETEILPGASNVTPGIVARASGLTPDRVQEDTVYVSTGRSVHVSFNRGDTFIEAYRLDATEGQAITHIAAGRNFDERGVSQRDVLAVLSADEPKAEPLTILRLAADGQVLTRGRDLDTSELAGSYVTSIARGAAPGQFLVLPGRDDQTRPGIFEYELSIDALLDLDTNDVSPWANAQATSPICTRWFGHDANRFYFVDADDGHAHVHTADDFCTQPDPSDSSELTIDIVDLPPARELAKGAEAVLDATRDLIQIDPGTTQDVGYRLSRGATPVPVDVAFLIDTSGSIRDNAAQLRAAFQQIVEGLAAREIDAYFGLAEFKDQSVRYRLRANIQDPTTGKFASELASLQFSGETEPHYTALHQLATGEGLEGPSVGTRVEPGQHMRWREESVRIVIMASDERDFDDPDGPGFVGAIDALNAKDIHHIGMHIRGEFNAAGTSADAPIADDTLLTLMQELSAGTEAFATAPIDCDGNGSNDVQPGDPLVCTLPNNVSPTSPIATSEALADAVVDLVSQVELQRAFTLETFVPAGFTAKVTSLSLDSTPSNPTQIADITVPQSRLWGITFGCVDQAQGRTATVPVNVDLERATIASRTAQLVCGDIPTPGVAPVRTPLAAIAPAVPAPPPAPIPANAPAPTAASANAFAQSAATSPAVGAAAAPQAQKQMQEAQIRDDDEVGYEFSALRREDPGPQTALIAGFVMAVGAGVAMSRQRRSEHARVRVRR